MAIMIFHSSAVAISYDAQNDTYSVFDSHSRGLDGLCEPNGLATLCILSSFQELCSFLRRLCVSLCSSKRLVEIQHEVCRIEIEKSKKRTKMAINIDTDEPDCCQECIQSVLDNEAPEKFVVYPEPNVDNLTKKKKHSRKFSEKSGSWTLVYICSYCTQTWFREGVQAASSLSVSSNLVQSCLLGIKSVDSVEWLYTICYRNIKSGKVPASSILNEMGFPEKNPRPAYN